MKPLSVTSTSKRWSIWSISTKTKKNTNTNTITNNLNRNRNQKKPMKRSSLFHLTLLVLVSFVVLPFVYFQYYLFLLDSSKAGHARQQQQQQQHQRSSAIFLQTLPDFSQHSRPEAAAAAVTSRSNHAEPDNNPRRRILTAYLESPSTIVHGGGNKAGGESFFRRQTSAATLQQVEFPHVSVCPSFNTNSTVGTTIPGRHGRAYLPDLPINDDTFPTTDPFLPWLHDYFVSADGRRIQFAAQNKRRCHTGTAHVNSMAYWAPQIALFQSIPITVVDEGNGRVTANTNNRNNHNHNHNTNTTQSTQYRLATSMENATYPATRFQCRFLRTTTGETRTTFSTYKFDYEYVSWRKLRRPMMDTQGKDTAMFWLSTLLFQCPIPPEWQSLASTPTSTESGIPHFYLDLVPIRTPVRSTSGTLLTRNHIGPTEYSRIPHWNLMQAFGSDSHILPAIDDAGRWANLPICPRPPQEQEQQQQKPPQQDRQGQGVTPTTSRSSSKPPLPPHQLVVCTWTAASYTRRGDATRISDSAARLREWILFHLMVGVDHVYLYDNTNMTTNDLQGQESVVWQVAQEFAVNDDSDSPANTKVTYHAWPCQICNNNRPAHSNPGERSSQYAAEASCRERYGPFTEWMTFLDVDEYLVPMKKKQINELRSTPKDSSANDLPSSVYHWGPILDETKAKGVQILQFRSSRAKPRVELMRELQDQSTCQDPLGEKKNGRFPNTDKCIGGGPTPTTAVPSATMDRQLPQTFLNLYNCDYIRSPKPDRFERARKQMYQPSYVWSHFVHYSTVTADTAETYAEFHERHGWNETYSTNAKGSRWERAIPEVFADELNTGALIHARSVLPHESRRRSVECMLGSTVGCMMGYVCENSVKFIDETHKDNVFRNPDGKYCNCWKNPVVDRYLVPLLEARLQAHHRALQLVSIEQR